MKPKRPGIIKAALLFAALSAAISPLFAELNVKPGRVLLVISDQWKDPSSALIADGGEFQELVTLLKSWGVPFDIARLDQERLEPARFLDMGGRPRYGAVLWDADTSAAILKQDYEILVRAVRDQHISLIALADRIREPAIQDLLGIRYLAEHPHSSSLKIAQPHFLTKGLPDPLDEGAGLPFKQRVQVRVEDARVLVKQGDYAQATIREINPDTRAIWIGGDSSRMLSFQPVRTLLRRALTSAVGYSLVKTWTNHIILMMDDLGNAQNAWLEHWHYPTLSADAIRKYLIGPLQANRAVMVVNVLPGFVDDSARRVVPSWQARFTDAFGVLQDYRSTKEGLDEGAKKGVFEIHSHGWTHMQPDLDSPPGPWWGTPVDGERAEVGWYREFYDVRRGAEIPAATQAFHLRRSKEWIKLQFGAEPLSFASGGNAVSLSLPNNTWKIAAREGFGWYGGYLGEDFAVQGNANATAPFGGTDDVPLILPAPPDGHDRGIALQPEGFAPVFQKYPAARFMGLDEYIGYIHAVVDSSAGALSLAISYHPRFGRYFETHPSEWTLHLSDWLEGQMRGGRWILQVDGETRAFRPAEWTVIPLAAGQPVHQVRLVSRSEQP